MIPNIPSSAPRLESWLRSATTSIQGKSRIHTPRCAIGGAACGLVSAAGYLIQAGPKFIIHITEIDLRRGLSDLWQDGKDGLCCVAIAVSSLVGGLIGIVYPPAASRFIAKSLPLEEVPRRLADLEKALEALTLYGVPAQPKDGEDQELYGPAKATYESLVKTVTKAFDAFMNELPNPDTLA